ncbi:MAG: YggS family pyridoxal phosphate-dependent enzyme [Proteobacteria bacterium]|nr:YggS family pyridoxal phosphate-dependent enzyme [Pseudomonadota bacterium]MCH9758200.1 YggS family pyridoxal phosphate-dependent enzyme [Pseudomonadota bacterium]
MLNAAEMSQNLQEIRAQIAACHRSDKRPDKPPAKIIAVSKTFPAAAVRAIYAAGVEDIGENYLQEAEEKIPACADLPLVWHFIGKIQKNKIKRIAALFDWVHSVDCFSYAERLSAARAADENEKPLNVLLQVNISAEESKSGVAVCEALPLARDIAALPNIRLRGLMILPLMTNAPQQQYDIFCRTAALQQQIAAAINLPLDCLSMGMSADYPQALRAGATHIRLGTALFGARAKKGT